MSKTKNELSEEVCIEAMPDARGFTGNPEMEDVRYEVEFDYAGYSIRVGLSPSRDFRGSSVRAEARIKGTVVGYSEGYQIFLHFYNDPGQFLLEMDAIDQYMYDSAVVIAELGEKFWKKRRILFLSTVAEVLPEHRRRGLGAILKKACLDISHFKKRTLNMLIKPYPIDIRLVRPEEIKGRPVLPAALWDEKIKQNAAYWKRQFPFLAPIECDWLPKGTAYYFGEVPQVSLG